jgi:hypothetical protein
VNYIAWYTNRDGALVDLQDNVVGKCYLYPSAALQCGLDPIGQVDGERKIRCEVDVTADQINSNRP